jgi:hypothetical protein
VRLDDVVMHRNGTGSRPRAELTLHGRGAVAAADTLLLPRPGGRAVERSRNAAVTFTRTHAWGDAIDPRPLPLLSGGNPLVPVADEAARRVFPRSVP